MLSDDALAELLRTTFAAELADQAQTLSAEVLALQDEPPDLERVRSLFRIAHTLKGAAAAAGLPVVAHVCHALEDRLSLARDGTRPLGPGDTALLLDAADTLTETSAQLLAGSPLDEVRLAALEARAQAAARRRATPPDAAGTGSTLALAASGTPAAGTAQAPAAVSAPASPAPPAPASAASVRVTEEKLEALVAAKGALFANRTSLEQRRGEIEQLHDSLREWTRKWARESRAVRVELAKHGASERSVQALGWLDANLKDSTRQLGRVTDAMTRDTRSMSQAVGEAAFRVQQIRMRPFRDACARLPRALHDATAATGREARLVIEDGGIELDRTVVDGLADALLPLLRNAVDHGIEAPEVRERLGKPRAGTITIRAALEGDRALITMTDDGGGVNEDAVRAAVVKRGLPAPETREAVAEAILRQTVSTRTEVSEISGRGVGVDIVVSAMHRIHGSIRMAWEKGRGTRFTLQCPPSLATLNVMVVEVGPHLLALPTSSVARVNRVNSDQVRIAGGRAMLLSAEGPMPLRSLAAILGPPLSDNKESSARHVVVLGPPRRRLAVVVDAVVGTHESVLRPVERHGETLPLVAGVMLLGSGRLATVLASSAVVDAGLATGAPLDVSTLPAPRTARRKPRVLVADDSITTRTLEAGLLQAAGYEVITAVDGADGWRVLQEQQIDLVVSDVEMPRMDGFDLCSAIRAAPRLVRLPVVLVTALESPAHRARGLEVGADAYVGKSTFEQDALLTVIRQLLGEELRP